MAALSNAEIVLRILLSLAMGGVLGMERGLKNRPAGTRTYMLVCLGACVVMMTGQLVYETYQTGDPARIGAQVVSGIGFLGAGSIVVTRHNQIKGLTTAAGLWASACVGLALGMGFYMVALTAGCAVFLVLTMMHQLDLYTRRHSRVLELYLELDCKANLGPFLRYARACALELTGIQNQTGEDPSGEEAAGFLVTVKAQTNASHQQILECIRRFDAVRHVEEI